MVVEKSLPFYLAIGVAQALAFLTALQTESVALAVFAGVLGCNMQLLGGLKRKGALLGACVLAVLLASITGWVGRELPEAPDSHSTLVGLWIFSAHFIAYVSTAFILAWRIEREPRLRYEDLFRHAWNTAFILLLGGLVTGLFWLMLWLCANLFLMIGIDVLDLLLHDRDFNAVILTVVFSLGMRMGHENDNVIGMLRGILLSLCRFLAPLAALIVVIFSLTLPFTGLEPVWQTGRASTILLCLVAVTVFLVNGVFQDGSQPYAYSRGLTRLVEASLLLLPLLTMLAGYSTWLRIEQYGLSPSRFSAALIVMVAACYSGAAVWAVLDRRSVWLARLRISNPVLAVLCCALLLIIQTPWLNPQALSARDQVQRLLDGRTPADQFDAAYLYGELGIPGREAFEQLSDSLPGSTRFEPPTRDLLAARLNEAREQGWVRVPVNNPSWIGKAVEGSEQFASPDMGYSVCSDVRCALWAVDLDGDGRDEVVQLSPGWSSLEFYRRDADGKWQRAGRLEGGFGRTDPADAIRAGKVQVVEPRYRSLDIGGQIYAPVEDALETEQ